MNEFFDPIKVAENRKFDDRVDYWIDVNDPQSVSDIEEYLANRYPVLSIVSNTNLSIDVPDIFDESNIVESDELGNEIGDTTYIETKYKLRQEPVVKTENYSTSDYFEDDYDEIMIRPANIVPPFSQRNR